MKNLHYSNFRIIVIFVIIAKIAVFSIAFLSLNDSAKANELKSPVVRKSLATVSPSPLEFIADLHPESPKPSPSPTPTSTPIPSPKYDPNPQRLLEIIKRDTGMYKATYGVFVKNLSTGQEITINSDETFTSASLYKMAVMYQIYKLAAEGKLDLEDPSIKKNMHAMITYSSNEASVWLVRNFTSWKEITDSMHSIGLTKTDLTSDPQVTSPGDMGKLIEMISNGQAVSMEASVAMLDLMVKQQKNDRIPVHLPPGVIVAHKTGELYDVRHDAGVVIGPKNNIILVLMSKDSKAPERVKPVMQQIAKDVYQFFDEQ